MQVEQHKWAEEGAELRGRLTAHEAQLDLMQQNMRESECARSNLAQDLARLRLELEKVVISHISPIVCPLLACLCSDVTLDSADQVVMKSCCKVHHAWAAMQMWMSPRTGHAA